MDRIDRYILKHMAGPFFGAFLGVLALLMLERMLRVIELVGENNGAVAYVFDMLASLVPHYLGMAIPAGLFIACYVAYRRLAQTSELAALASLGRGLGRLARPAIAAALVLAAVSILVHSHLQPHGRYVYRTLKFLVANASVATALEAGAFFQFGDITIIAEKSEPGGSQLGKVFVHEKRPNGGSRTITSGEARLVESDDGDQAAVEFSDGLLIDVEPDGDRNVIRFESFDWPIDRAALGELRPRGQSESEMTWPEMLATLDQPPDHVPPDRLHAEFHSRTVKALTVLIIPFLAIPLAAMGGRTRTSIPLASGVIAFLIYVQSIQMLEGLADIGRVPAGPSIWTPFVLLALGSGILFWRVWRRVAFEPAIGGAPRIRLPKRRRRRRLASEAAEA